MGDKINSALSKAGVLTISAPCESQSVEDKSRVFQQRFSLPAGVQPHQVQSSLTRDGILLITAQREEEEEREQIEEKMKQVLSPASWGGDKGPDDGRPARPAFTDSKQTGGWEGDQYKIRVNVESFNPEDLVIKTVDNRVIVEASNQGRTFSQAFTLPASIS